MKKTGGAAFPRPCGETSQGGNYEQDGMTLRDYFASKAMQGMLASMVESCNWPDEKGCYNISMQAYIIADAMIAARNA